MSDTIEEARKDLLDASFEVVVIGRTAHAVQEGCWSLDDHMIPLTTFAEAMKHNYDPCRTCSPRTPAASAVPETATEEDRPG